MKFANLDGRLQLVTDAGLIDVAAASEDNLPSAPEHAFDRWDEIVAWARQASPAGVRPYDASDLGPVSPRPSQIFAIGLNYRPHAEESGLAIPEFPFVFTKTNACIAAPTGQLTLTGDTVDWEVELVAIIGKPAYRISPESAWEHVAALSVGQDFSDRAVQGRLGLNSQPTLGKSAPGFGPVGPLLVTPDEFADRDDIAISCSVNGEVMQSGRTSELIFDIPTIVSYLSQAIPLSPGDIIFTGTPAGVGFGRKPQVFLREGDVVETWAEGIGTMTHTAVGRDA